MAYYNFRVDDGDPAGLESDPIELPDLAAVRREAVRFAGAMISDLGSAFWSRPALTLEVADAHGTPLFELVVQGRQGSQLEEPTAAS